MCPSVMECGASEEQLLVDLAGRMIGSCSWLLTDSIMMIDYANTIRGVP